MRSLTLLAWLAIVLLATLQSSYAKHAPLGERAGHLLVKRSRSKCGPNLGTSTDSRLGSLSFGTIEIVRNGSNLDSRMELPRRSLSAFYARELPRISEQIVPHGSAPSATDMSTAVLTTFSSLESGKAYSTGMSGLQGCTALYIISRKGVYATHWWENVSFSPDAIWRTEELQTDAQLFQATVIDMLTKGGDYHPLLDASELEDQFIKAYLIHPTQTFQEGSDDKGYTTQWNKIVETVGDIIPTLKDASRWGDVSYVATDDPFVLDSSNRFEGKNLFKYDPAHVLDPKTKRTTRKATLWVENSITPIHDDEW